MEELSEFVNAMGTAREERTGLASSSVEDAHRGSAISNTHGDVDDDVIDDDAASFSVGDSVQIMGLVSATQYNDMRGIVVSDFDPTTNRCGVKVRGGKGLILALQVHNLTMIRRAKKSSNVEVEEANESVEAKEEVFPSTETLYIGDKVTIMGLVNESKKYNFMMGIIVSELDVTTDRYCVGVGTGNYSKVIMAIHVTNLKLDSRANESTIGHFDDDRKYSVINNEAERSKLQQENMAILRDFEAFAIPLSGLSSPASFIQPTDSRCPCCLHVHKPDMWGFIAWSIIEKWREQASSTGFVRFLNGISTDCREENMQLVSLRDALVNINEWKVDWDKKLTPNEIRKVNNQNYWRSMILDQGNDLDEEIEGTEYEDIIDDEIERSLHIATPPPANNYGLNPATDSHNTKQAARIMKNFRKCKKDAVNSLLSTLGRDNLDSYQQALVDRGLISVTLGFLSQCEHEDFNDMVGRVKGNLQTPVYWITILAHLGNLEQCKLEIANGIQAVIRCLCDDTKRLFFKSNKYWHEAVGEFAILLLCLLRPSSADLSLKVTTTTVYNLLQSEGFLESIVQKQFWSSHRPDLVQEYESYPHSFGIKRHEAFFHDVMRNIIFIGLKRDAGDNTTSNVWICDFCGLEFDNYMQCVEHEVGCSKNNQPGEGPPSSLCAVVKMVAWPVVDLIKTIVKTPVVSRAYNPKCNVYFILGMIRMLKNVNSDDSIDRRNYFDTLLIVFTSLMFTADCVDNVVIEEVIDLGRRFTNNIDDAMSISKLSFSMLVRKEHGNMYPIDKRIAFVIKSGMLEMCFEFITRFECVQLIAPDPSRDELMIRFRMMEALVCIAELIQDVALHQKTAKAIRDHRSQIMEALSSLSIQAETEQSLQYFEILSSVIDLNEGSCSRCNKPIDWRTALFCAGCRRVAYCGLKCQKKDWKHGTHSSNCSFLTQFGLTTFEVKSSRNISKLTGLRNNIVTSQKKLFLRHEVELSSQLLTYVDRSDYIAVFDLSNKQEPISVVHYHDQFTCNCCKQNSRKWFEDFRSPDKIICLFVSHVLNGEMDEDGDNNIISLWTAFPLPKCTKPDLEPTLWATHINSN